MKKKLKVVAVLVVLLSICLFFLAKAIDRFQIRNLTIQKMITDRIVLKEAKRLKKEKERSIYSFFNSVQIGNETETFELKQFLNNSDLPLDNILEDLVNQQFFSFTTDYYGQIKKYQNEDITIVKCLNQDIFIGEYLNYDICKMQEKN